MGIRFFNTITNKQDRFIYSNCDYVLLDCNYLLYKISNTGINTDEEILETLIYKIKKFMESIIYKHFIIFIDGIPPECKLKKQKISRLMYQEEIYKQNTWDQNKISVGSPFHYKFIEKLNENFPEIVNIDNGEAEHNIMKLVKKLHNQKILIISPDSDMILLSTLHKGTNDITIYSEHDKKNIYVNTFNEIKSGNPKFYDFIYLLNLFGNDFIENIIDFVFLRRCFSMDNYIKAINSYKNPIFNKKGYFINNNSIIRIFLFFI